MTLGNGPRNAGRTILLTGGAGYIGSHVAVELMRQGRNVVVLDNLCNSHPDVLKRVGAITGRVPGLVVGDVRDTDLVARTLRDHGCDGVVHLAGLKAVGESVAKPLDYYAANVQGAISLFQAMVTTGVKKLVFSSSATVYGIPQSLPLDEDHRTSPTNPYGWTKLHIEQMLSDICQADPSWRALCLRYFNPVGADATGLLGEDPVGVPNNLMPYVARVAVGVLPRLVVFGNDYETPDGTGVRDYIHVSDLADGHLAALAYLDEHGGFDVVNLGTGQGHSVLQLIDTFAAVSGREIPFEFGPRRAGDIASCYASPGKAARLWNWSARRSLHDMCADTWRWQSRRQGEIGRAPA